MKNLIYSALLLLTIGAVTTATSTNEGKNLPVIRSYTVVSTCSNATITSGTLIATDNNVTSPLNSTFLNTGLPMASLIIGAESNVTATIAPALVRSCDYSTMTVGATVASIYTCNDNSVYACNVTFTPIQ